MCGRYTLSTPDDVLAALLGVVGWPGRRPRWNIAPTQDVPIVRMGAGDHREPAFAHWGLIPHWADDPSIGGRMINARSETVAQKPAFRDSFRKRRCLIPADSFFEWAKLPSGQKQPMLIRLKDKSPMVFAGLWAHWDKDGKPIDSCTILTTSANDKLRPLHDRMPVILHPRSFSVWLDPERTEATRLKGVMQPYEPEEL